MLNAAPLNSGPLNGSPSEQGGAEPADIAPGSSHVWGLTLLVGGQDMTDRLTGQLRLQAQEAGDRLASFALWLGPDPVSVQALVGQPVVIDYTLHGEPDVTSRRFTGELTQPSFDPLTRVLSCDCTTGLERTVEAMTHEQIELLVGGLWSDDVFDELPGRPHWDYALERLSTRPAGLHADRQGNPVVTPWHSNGLHWRFTTGSTLHDSVDVGLTALTDAINVVELELDYRYSRYRQRNQSYSWTHPDGRGTSGFEAWRQDSTELPDIPMVIDAVTSAGWFMRSATWYRLPGDQPNLPQPWYNKNTDLLLGADFSISRRWTQRGVEQYRLRFEAADAVAQAGEVISRQRIVLDTDTAADNLWEQSGTGLSSTGTQGPGLETPSSTRDADRLANALNTAMAMARVELLAAQRLDRVAWQIPLAHALGVDIGHGSQLQDQGATATGTVTELVEELDLTTGSALLTITTAVSRGSSTSDPLTQPAQPGYDDDFSPPAEFFLPTQLGMFETSPEYDDELPGFAGNKSISNQPPENRFPRRFAINAPDIPEQWRDEIAAESTATYHIAPPADVLEM